MRVDGQAWSPRGNGGIIRGWTYPKEGTSPQFDRMNDNARALDDFWNQLSDGERAAWDGAAVDGREWESCVEDEDYAS